MILFAPGEYFVLQKVELEVDLAHGEKLLYLFKYFQSFIVKELILYQNYKCFTN